MLSLLSFFHGWEVCRQVIMEQGLGFSKIKGQFTVLT